ncbi:MAG: chemotaxis-specific protein-glutamate methyltransferase CheB [Myxococcota bacterium]
MTETRETSVLIVDDSAFNRRTIGEVLEQIEGVHVIGKASDGDEALRMVAGLEPDLITLDLEMPRMDGFTFLRLLMARRPTPVIVVSGYSEKGNVFRALELGALDFVAKPSRHATLDLADIRRELTEKVGLIRHLSRDRMAARRPAGPSGSGPAPAPAGLARHRAPRRVALIGASTGGPSALVELFRHLPGKADAAVLVAQHMPERFTRTFAERLNRLGGLQVREASGRHPLRPGEAWICPGGRCLVVEGEEIVVVEPAPSDRYVPSVDRLFRSAATALGADIVAAVLTGMGDDGAVGVPLLAESGALVLAESAETAVIHGMPGAAVRTGAVHEELPLPELAKRLARELR